MNRLPPLLLFLLTAACHSQPDRPTEPAAPAASSAPTAPKRDTASPVVPSGGPATLALADNAVQLVNAKTTPPPPFRWAGRLTRWSGP